MRKLTSYTITFVIGFALCALAVNLSHGAAPFSLSGPESKNLVLTRLEAPAPVHDRVGNETIITKAAATIEPSIVTIDVESKPIAVQSPFSGDPFFRRFFGDQTPFGDQGGRTQRTKGVGSGVIISDDGYILTNHHVVKNAATVKILLSDGKAYRAKVVGADQTTDIAVVKIDAPEEKLRPAQFADSKALEVGDMVIAAGNPLNIGTTVTFGIISALGHRNSEVTGPSAISNDIIQTDAAINPGNSGGALADMEGRVVGINEAIVSPTGSYVGIGLAIPINTAKDIAYQLIKNGKVIRPYIGIGYVPLKAVAKDDRAQLGITIDGDHGVVVTNVYSGSPAEAAGLHPYDVILDANAQQLTDTNSLQQVIAKLKVGDRLVLRVDRKGDTKFVSVKVAEMPAQFGDGSGNDDQNDQMP
ncbi:MAG: trypsin-like peptidase domain-containing protein [Capsulimonadaceae bacterium]|nr:trypsin-like peptidase domain-containing protein [Capsulimonadaceae bacterium]